MESFYKVIEAAIADIEAHGYDSQARIDGWLTRIEQAAVMSSVPESVLAETLSRTMQSIYGRMIERGGYSQVHKGVSRFTVERLKPRLRSELDRRMMASADLIKLNRNQMIAQTKQRFSGWSTSIPKGGSRAVDRTEVKANLKKSFAALPYEERRVMIDQGHKLTSELNNIIAVDGGAIAAVWHSHFRQPGYNARPDHAEFDGKIFVVRGNWAMEKALMKVDGHQYTDEIDRPGQPVFCFPGDSEIPYANLVEKAYRRWYDGELTEIVTESGKTLRATPNHPVLTPLGWKAIGLLNEGDDVIEVADYFIGLAEKYQKNRVPTISEIFGSVQENGVMESLNQGPADFHGDGSQGKVDVVFSARALVVNCMAPRPKSVREFIFAASDTTFAVCCAGLKCFGRLLLAAQGFMSGLDKPLAPIGALSTHSDLIGVGSSSDFDAVSLDTARNQTSGDAESGCDGKTAFSIGVGLRNFFGINVRALNSFRKRSTDLETEGMQTVEKRRHFPAEDLCDLTDRLPFIAKPTHVVKINRSSFSGHVYNLQTIDGWYVSNGILAHNCRCSYSYLYNLRDLPESMLTAKGRESLASIRT